MLSAFTLSLSSFVKTIYRAETHVLSLTNYHPLKLKNEFEYVATHSRFILYLRNGNKYMKTEVSASSSNSAEGNDVGMIKNNGVVMGKELVL